MAQKIVPTQQEILMRDDAFIVTKTDTAGRITYANPIFIEFSGFSEAELLGKQHNIVRHPDMPRTVFQMLWSTVKSGDEFCGYVKNLSRDGSFYWVFATVTPSYATENAGASEIIGYFSVRRRPDKTKLSIVQPLYRDMLAAENRADRRDAIAAGTEVLNTVLHSSGKTYHEFIHTL